MNNWNLELLYKDINEWEADFAKMDFYIDSIAALNGKLNTKDGILKYLELDEELDKLVDKVYHYAAMKHDLNQKDQESSVYYARVYSKFSELGQKTAFVSPQILANGYEVCKSWLVDRPDMGYRFEQLFRTQKYVLDEKSEGIMANYRQATSGYNKLYDSLAVVDNRNVKVTLSDGKEYEISNANYRAYLGELSDPEDRRLVFEAIFKFYDEHKTTFAGIYNGIMQSELTSVKNRGYENILESHLYHNNIDPKVFHSLISTARGNCEPLKKYIKLRQKYFNLETYHTYDRFLDFKKSNLKFEYEEAKNIFFEAAKSLGEDFYNHACKVLEDGRVSVYPADGKQTGAYSTGVYGVGPFILLNHTNTLDDAFTVAHEAGHSMHTMYSEENQPFSNKNYVIFVAEVASTFNEQLLLDHLLAKVDNKDDKVVILAQAIDGLIGTFYRQTLFANYEYEAHKLVEEGKVVDAQSLSKIMVDLYKDYYDIDLNNEPYKDKVWAYIPHFFHSPFYVYQYATSFSASLAIYDRVKNKVEGAYEGYLEMLKAGGSDYPINIIKKAGVDLSTEEPFKAVVKRLAELVDMLEELI